MLEGVEYEKKIGEYGSATVDVGGDLKVKIAVGVEIDIIGELKKLAAKTETQVDDQALAWIESVLAKAKSA